MNSIIQFALGTGIGFLAFLFIYASMDKSQRKSVRKMKLAVEVGFFFAPFGISILSGTSTAILTALGMGIGLSMASLFVRMINFRPTQGKKQVKKEQNTPLDPFSEFCENMSLEEIEEYGKRRGW